MKMNPLQNLLINNRGRGKFNAQVQGDETTMYLYDVIVNDDYWGGVSADTFVKAINEIDTPTIHLRINSPGGDVFAGRAIEQAVREHKSQVIAHVDGYAASAATLPAVAADKVIMSEGSFFMVHKAWTLAMGNSDDLMDVAALLEKVDGTLMSTYAKKTGADLEQIAEWMTAETWFTADEALEAGFADEIVEEEVSGSWDLAAYRHAPNPEAKIAKPIHSQAYTDYLKRKLQLVEKNAA